MATVTKPSVPQFDKQPQDRPRDPDQLRRDRIVGLLTLFIIVALMALMIWLASLGGGGAIEHYPIMP